MTTTPKEVEELIVKSAKKAGWNRAGEPWYEPDAGALVPKLVDVVGEQGLEVIALRQALTDRTAERDQLLGLLRAVDSFVVDAIGLLSRGSILKDAIDEATGMRDLIHRRDTIPPAPPVPEEFRRVT